nr:sugar phosphate isomerase/epimerase family protein [Ruegeria atlantica]
MMDLEIASSLGFDGIELSVAKMRAFLAAGFCRDELKSQIGDIWIPGIGFLLDIERQGDDAERLLKEAEELFDLAAAVGAKGVQILTGPVDIQSVRNHASHLPIQGYAGLLSYPRAEQIKLSAKNLKVLADMAAGRGLVLYLEALGWAPVNTIADQCELLDRADRDNLKMVVDFWHCYVSGDTPETVARIDKDRIYGVHVCDSLPFLGGIPDERVLRDLPTGSGALDLREWCDAVKSTGYVGWWSPELFCRKQHQSNSFQMATELKSLLENLIR